MLSFMNANVPAAIKTSKPNRTSGRRVKPKMRSPLSRDGLPIRTLRYAPTKKGQDLFPRTPPFDANGRQILTRLEVQNRETRTGQIVYIESAASEGRDPGAVDKNGKIINTPPRVNLNRALRAGIGHCARRAEFYCA